MNLLNIFTRYPDQEACVEHLEEVRWGKRAVLSALWRARCCP